MDDTPYYYFVVAVTPNGSSAPSRPVGCQTSQYVATISATAWLSPDNTQAQLSAIIAAVDPAEDPAATSDSFTFQWVLRSQGDATIAPTIGSPNRQSTPVYFAASGTYVFDGQALDKVGYTNLAEVTVVVGNLIDRQPPFNLSILRKTYRPCCPSTLSFELPSGP